MNRKERVAAAIKHQQCDFVPYNIDLTGEEIVKVTDFLGIEKGAFADFAGNHIEKLGYNGRGSYIKEGFFKDEFGVVWNRSGIDKDIWVIDEYLLKEPDLSGYEFPMPDLERVKADTAKFVANGKDTFKFGKIGMTFFERAWSLRGIENFLMDLHLYPEFVNSVFENILKYNMQIIDAALDLLKCHREMQVKKQSTQCRAKTLWAEQ